MGKLNFIQTLISVLLVGFVLVDATGRTLSGQLNPDCPPDVCVSEDVNNKTTLIHIQATGENDTLHYIWDLTRQPTVLVARCAKDTNITIHWNKTLKDVDSVVFTPKPKYTMAFVLTKVFIYDDIKDKASIIGVNASLIETIDTSNLIWRRENYVNATGEVQVTVSGRNETLIGNDGVINLKLKCYGDEDHDSVTPHLLHSINVTQVDLEFVDLLSTASFGSPRIAGEFVLVASESNKRKFSINKRKTIDDEHTPGIFTLVDIMSPDGLNGTQGSYMQFRPISYTKEDRDINSKTDVVVNNPQSIDDPQSFLNASLVSIYYGKDLDTNLMQVFNVSIGQTEDKFYSSTNYTTWTFVLGYGTTPPEHVSMIVAILACIGLGIPLILLIAGGIYLAVKRMRNC